MCSANRQLILAHLQKVIDRKAYNEQRNFHVTLITQENKRFLNVRHVTDKTTFRKTS